MERLERVCVFCVIVTTVMATPTDNIVTTTYGAVRGKATPTDNIVTTTYGAVQGKAVTTNNETVHQFLKLPFAKPPVGNLRFKKPRRPDSWNGTLQAVHHGPPCMQRLLRRYKDVLDNSAISEDCLYLNVYVPGQINITANLSVMVYIHGGGYRSKTASLYDGSFLAQHGDVIVVVTNYRLGFFGFLSTEDESAKGNYGLWDQIYALRWVQENIRSFGGNPEKVTVFGHSAGGYSIGLLLLSAESKDLFRRAIPMSGFGLSPRAITHNPRNAATRLATKLGCVPSGRIDGTVLDCMRNKTAQELLNGQNSIVTEDSSSPQFIMRPAPVIDREILMDTPQTIIYDGDSDGCQRFLSADYMAGTNSADGGLIRSYLKVIQTRYNFTLSDGAPTTALCGSIAPALSRDYYGSNAKISDAICVNYTSNGTLADQARRLVHVFGDMMYDSRAVQTLERHISGTTLSYQFILSHKSSFVTTPNLPSWLNGAYHGDELVYIFGMPVYNFSRSERLLSEAVMTYLTNFAKYGDPNGLNTTVSSLPLWPQFDHGQRHYMDFDLNLTVKSHLRRNMVNFWLETVPALNKTVSDEVSMATKSRPLMWFPIFLCFLVVLSLRF
ncbi:acetylcholinesterase-like [Pecten maximus]|uniref:acetylcholinesterase-like n=1 Tax=Pecten maximus TaxID=6579 RepID=UPI0014589256|nr:acetylcholinesterase-like [Pecten maximus]